MAGINAQAIKELRERTQAGMSDCKSALTEAEGDMDKAVEIILKKGLAKSAKKASAAATEGEVRASVSADKRRATMVEVNIQTDFAARNDSFRDFVGEVLAAAEKASAGAKLGEVTLASGKTIADAATELTGRIGEKIDARRWDVVEIPEGKHGAVAAYVHLGGKIGVIVAVETDTALVASHREVVKFLEETAMQAAAMSPVALRREDISDEDKAKQKEIFEGQLREDPKPKPEAAWPKIIEGKFNKWYSEAVLLEQESVEAASRGVSGQTIEKLRAEAEKAAGGSVTVTRFVRFERGEGIAKKEDDFAAEVAKMASA
ncbi:translation elongation factor Ts [Chondromyces apiculatus]|uniref:Elongation factor Ts n=1 Tax=Chondromyces apiculatus DSM 436 TaxID=1192034 RepID=A0A017SY06_9BACT|nr:translation elongation factor Ts [Chondromyces apiculatus]EYF01632.1 Translation elongation factor Ts [Chondromyces apiculatus DSM 436]